MRNVAKTLLLLVCLVLSSGCATKLTWQDVAQQNQGLAGQVEGQFLKTAWDAYLLGCQQRGDPQQEWRKHVVGQFGLLQAGVFENASMYAIVRKESEASPEKLRVFEDVDQAASAMEADYRKVFGKNTKLEYYKMIKAMTEKMAHKAGPAGGSSPSTP